nr:reverse transcriptase domain-containing protein [Tanacetum cinerariifolium]
TRQGQNPPPPNTNTPPHHMTPESVQATINQALLRKSTNGDGSQSLHEDNLRHVQTTRHCFYADFMKCHPLNFKGNEGVVGLTQWIEKMESVFNISDFSKCKPHTFSGTEGVVGLTHWFKKMETVFNISNCPSKCQVKYATYTLQDSALTWWNSHKRTIGVDVAYAMKWVGLMKLMTKVYCPRNEIQKMKTEL